MTLSGLAKDLIPVLLAALVPVTIAAVSVLTKALWDLLRQRFKLEMQDKYFNMANDAVLTAVAEVMQTYVDAIKNTEKWDDEAKSKAFRDAMLRAQEIMGVAALQALPEIVGDVEKWLASKIEAATRTLKTSQPIAA